MTPLPAEWIALGVMSAITIGLRALPLMIRRSVLNTTRMNRLNQDLPLCVMVILVAHALNGGGADVEALVPRLLALGAVSLSYWFWRNALLSIIAGLLILSILVSG